jgi:hypothetical protein
MTHSELKENFPLVKDKDLPGLFPALDALAEKLFLRRNSLNP